MASIKYTARSSFILTTLASIVAVTISAAAIAQDVIAPPSLGDQTKGTPAIVETEEVSAINSATSEQSQTKTTGLFADAEITERRYENGKVYRVELEHPMGSKQYIDADNAEGEIKTGDRDYEQAPNLAKWRLGSW